MLYITIRIKQPMRISLYYIIIIYHWVNGDKIIIFVIIRDCKTTTTAIIIVETNIIFNNIVFFIRWYWRVSVHKLNLLAPVNNHFVSNLIIILYGLWIKCFVNCFRHHIRLCDCDLYNMPTALIPVL